MSIIMVHPQTSFFGTCDLANGQDLWLEYKSFRLVARTSLASDQNLLSENRISLTCSHLAKRMWFVWFVHLCKQDVISRKWNILTRYKVLATRCLAGSASVIVIIIIIIIIIVIISQHGVMTPTVQACPAIVPSLVSAAMDCRLANRWRSEIEVRFSVNS